MKNSVKILTVVCVVLALESVIYAVPLFDVDFENGGGHNTVIPVGTAVQGGVTDVATWLYGTSDPVIKLTGVGGFGSGKVANLYDPYTTAAGFAFVGDPLDAASSGTVDISWDMLSSSYNKSAAASILVELENSSGANILRMTVQTRSNVDHVRIYIEEYAGGGNTLYDPLAPNGVTILNDIGFNMNIVLDMDNDTADIYANNDLIHSATIGAGEDYLGLQFRTVSGGNWIGQFDNISIVPEPATVALLGGGLLGLLLKRKRLKS